MPVGKVVLIAALLCALCGVALVAQLQPAPVPVEFRNVAASAGIDFVLENGATPEKHIIETMAGGVVAFDADGDGLTDLFFTNGAAVPSLNKYKADAPGRRPGPTARRSERALKSAPAAATPGAAPSAGQPDFRNRLYRNLGNMKFRDVTAESGLAGEGYSMGAAAADYDNDGDVDLFVAGVRTNHLYRNDGKGHFEDVTAAAGIRGGVWAITGGWFDYDNDGRLDLLVVNYLKWSPDNVPECGDPPRVRSYCHPKLFEGLPNVLYRNRGDGTFEDVSVKSGIAAHTGKGMSVAFGDYDLDGDTDVFVTNDKIPSFLFRNNGDGTFTEVGAEAGVALPDHGRPVSAMGADCRDYDNDGLPDITYAALAGELFPLFRNQGQGWFRDVSYRSRIGPLSIARSGWSPGLFDFNNDGFKDLFVTGGHVNDTVEAFEAVKYKTPNALFLNAGDGTFRDGSPEAGPDFQLPAAHRGCAFADFNNDGLIDVAVTSIGARAELWENVTKGAGAWLIVKPAGRRANRDGLGVQMRIGSQANTMTSNVGYSSSSHFGVHFGTGAAKTVDVEVRWPDGVRRMLKGVRTGQVLRVEE